MSAKLKYCDWIEKQSAELQFETDMNKIADAYVWYCLSQSKVLPEDVERAIESKYPSGEDGDFLEAALSYDCNKAAKWGYSLATDKSDAIKFGEWLSNNTEQYHLNEWMYNGRIHLTEKLYGVFKTQK